MGGGVATATLLHSRPRARFTAETAAEFYRRKKSHVVVRHVNGDRIVAMLEIVSPGNKSTGHAFRAFVDKACELLEYRIHLLIVEMLEDPVSIWRLEQRRERKAQSKRRRAAAAYRRQIALAESQLAMKTENQA